MIESRISSNGNSGITFIVTGVDVPGGLKHQCVTQGHTSEKLRLDTIQPFIQDKREIALWWKTDKGYSLIAPIRGTGGRCDFEWFGSMQPPEGSDGNVYLTTLPLENIHDTILFSIVLDFKKSTK